MCLLTIFLWICSCRICTACSCGWFVKSSCLIQWDLSDSNPIQHFSVTRFLKTLNYHKLAMWYRHFQILFFSWLLLKIFILFVDKFLSYAIMFGCWSLNSLHAFIYRTILGFLLTKMESFYKMEGFVGLRPLHRWLSTSHML